MDLPQLDSPRFSAHMNRPPENRVDFVQATASYLKHSRLCLWCNCQGELSMYNFRIFEGPLNVVITDVRDVALLVGVLGAGQVVLVLQDARLVAAPLLTPQ